MNLDEMPTTDTEALILGLYLCLTAPDKQSRDAVIKLSTQVSLKMTSTQIAYAKEQAEAKYIETKLNQN